MFEFLKRWRERWSNWTGDRDLEMAIRRHLSNDGYYGGSAKLMNVRLAAVQRPGWLQVYRFDAHAKPSHAHPRTAGASLSDRQHSMTSEVAEGGEGDANEGIKFQHLFGLVREDARRDETIVRIFHSEAARRELFATWSSDLIQLRGGQAMR